MSNEEEHADYQGSRSQRSRRSAGKSDVADHNDVDLELQDQKDQSFTSKNRPSSRASRKTNDAPVEDEPLDVQGMKDRLNDQSKMLVIVKEFEKVYFESKQNYNKLDGITMNSNMTIKSLRHCYKINAKYLHPEDASWDTLQMGGQLDEMGKAIDEVNQKYNGLKGQEMQLSEQIINKDTSAFKLARIEKAKKQQDAFYEKIDDIDDRIYEQEKASNDLWQQYEDFNESLFKKKLSETTELIAATVQQMKEINEQIASMKANYDKVRADQDIVVPFTPEQKKQCNKVYAEIAKVGLTISTAEQRMAKEAKSEVKLAAGHKECQDIVILVSKMNEANDLVHLVEVTERLGELCTNYVDYVELKKRLKSLQEEDIVPAAAAVQKQGQDLQQYIEEVKKSMKAEFTDLIQKIVAQAKKNGDDAQVQNQRLNDFEARNIDDPAQAKNIASADLLFLKKEIARNDVSIGTVQSVKDNLLEECLALEAERKKKEANGDALIDPDHINALQRNFKTLETQSLLEIPRIKKNIDQLEAYTIKSLKNKLNDDNKKSQTQISAMKKRFEDLQKYIDALNLKVGTVRKNIASVHTQFNDEDLEKDNEFRDELEAKTTECDNDINGDKSSRNADQASQDGSQPDAKMSLIARKKQIIANVNKMVNQFNENNKLIKDSNKSPKTDKEINEIISKSLDLQNFCAEIDGKVSDGKALATEIDERLEAIMKHKIPELAAKYTTKNEVIDECDELFDANEAKVNKLEATLKEKTAKVDQVIA